MSSRDNSLLSLSPGEWLKYRLIPGRWYAWFHARRNLRWGERELAYLPHLVDPDRGAIDVGANKGVYSYFLARLCPSVVAFEPNPKLIPVLRRCVASNVRVEPVALSNHRGEVEMRLPRTARGVSNQLGTLRRTESFPDYVTINVQAARLDDYHFDNIGFMKIDVEGHELEVLEGGRETIARCRPTLLLELEQKHLGYPVTRAIAAVEAYGYEGYVLAADGLKSVRRFDPDREYRKNVAPRDYIYNFIFLPR